MKERKVKVTPSFTRINDTQVFSNGLSKIVLVGGTPRGHRVVVELNSMPPYVVKQLATQCIHLLQIQRDRAMSNVAEIRHTAAQ